MSRNAQKRQEWRDKCRRDGSGNEEACNALKPCIWRPLTNTCSGPITQQKKRRELRTLYVGRRQKIMNRANIAIKELLDETSAERMTKLQAIKQRQKA